MGWSLFSARAVCVLFVHVSYPNPLPPTSTHPFPPTNYMGLVCVALSHYYNSNLKQFALLLHEWNDDEKQKSFIITHNMVYFSHIKTCSASKMMMTESEDNIIIACWAYTSKCSLHLRRKFCL